MNEKEETTQETQLDMVVRMSQGNPGAISVLSQLLKDDDEFHIGIHAIKLLDDAEIYGSDIWILYKDYCYEDLDIFEFHLGLTPYDTLREQVAAKR